MQSVWKVMYIASYITCGIVLDLCIAIVLKLTL